jgi:hypothetical protein
MLDGLRPQRLFDLAPPVAPTFKSDERFRFLKALNDMAGGQGQNHAEGEGRTRRDCPGHGPELC